MSDKDIGQAMLRSEDQIDHQALTDQVLWRDRRRLWSLGIVCVIAWMAVVMLPWATIMPMLAKVTGESDAGRPLFVGEPKDVAEVVRVGTIATFIGSVASMFVAAVCTVALIILSRRATLRQVNARLQEISVQIKRLQPAEG